MYDAVVLGLGGMGSAALCHLARRGLRVLGLEQFDVAHDRGSSHGDTRIIRTAYFEHPDYVPLLRRARAEWDALERESGATLLTRSGLLLAGRPDGVVIPGVRRSAAEHHLTIESLSTAVARTRFPGLRIDDGFEVLYEADAGFLHVERCVRTHVELAQRHGADVRTHAEALEWSVHDHAPGGPCVTIRSSRGSYQARSLVITAGPWSSRVLNELGLPLTVRRKVQLWFPTVNPSHRLAAGFPAFCFDTAEGFFYGFPALDPAQVSGASGAPTSTVAEMKIAEHTGGETVPDPSAIDRSLHVRDIKRVAAFVRARLPGVSATPVRHSVCMYTMTPDEHFAVDLHPKHRNVVFAAGFSGHGFKFASVMGSILADLVEHGATHEPIGFLTVSRLRPGKVTNGRRL